jgi:hypothetical protein
MRCQHVLIGSDAPFLTYFWTYFRGRALTVSIVPQGQVLRRNSFVFVLFKVDRTTSFYMRLNADVTQARGHCSSAVARRAQTTF